MSTNRRVIVSSVPLTITSPSSTGSSADAAGGASWAKAGAPDRANAAQAAARQDLMRIP
jgi:hypothetical protein